MFGILSSFNIWASSSQFLNDSSEFTYSTELIAEIATELRSRSKDWFEQQLLGHAIALHNSHSFKQQVFVFSLSEDGDLLSQWRAYGRPADSYAMGFATNVLTQVLTAQRVLLAPCLYVRDVQVSKIRTVIDVTLRDFHSKGFTTADAERQPLSGELAEAISKVALAFVQVATLIKHPSFSEEREWRLVRIGTECQFSFRPGRSNLVPYIELSLATGLSQGLLREVVIGPSQQHRLDAAALEWFLNERGVVGTKVRPSNVPFRAW